MMTFLTCGALISAILTPFPQEPQQRSPTKGQKRLQITIPKPGAVFAAPVPLMVHGDGKATQLGSDLSYPTPRLYDIDGDGQREMVVGDLTGRVHVSRRAAGDDPAAWGALDPFTTGDRALKFHNW